MVTETTETTETTDCFQGRLFFAVKLNTSAPPKKHTDSHTHTRTE